MAPWDTVDPAVFEPDKTLAKIAEIEKRLDTEIKAAAMKREDAVFISPFVAYLGLWASRIAQYVDGPVDLLALAVRNLLEFSILLPVVFHDWDSKTLFINEVRLDSVDIQIRIEQLFSEAGVNPPPPKNNWGELKDLLPDSDSRLKGKRDLHDSTIHEFCSKLMHPSALVILTAESVADPPKRTVLRWAGLEYRERSYNFLANQVYGPDALAQSQGNAIVEVPD